ncbi:hypothetical protein [Methylocapsa sp. S129]|uniref:hypothetical protein n=1 Tax=Methylocapsa sp. S129 TaxID=1641869 RepID=UPI00131E28D2|nr:hypothetical protein [Methylocapsa sp. S129]
MADAQFRRAYLLGRAFDVNEVVTVDGVMFNMQCELDKSVWRPVYPLGLHGHVAALYGPEIAFPWTPSYWRKLFAEEVLASESEIVEAKPGCLISIARIETAKFKTPYADFAFDGEREGKRAYLSVRDARGVTKEVTRPLVLLPRSATAQLIDVGNYSAAYDSMIAKLEKALGVSDIDGLLDRPVSEWPEPRTNIDPDYKTAFMVLTMASRDGNEAAFAAFGYIMARAEGQNMLMESAIRGKASKVHQAKAANARHAKSVLATEPIRDMARQIIAAEGDISLTKCARLVADEFRGKPNLGKSGDDPKWIAKHIKVLFEQRGSRKEYRPKRKDS